MYSRVIKLNIYTEEEQAQFSIFQTEIGDYNVGKSLSDEKLFALCRDHGDSKGSLKFFVTHTPLSETERSPRSPPQLPPQPQFSNIPPVFSTHNPVTPLRPSKRKPRSRHGSVSSAASEQPYESATGYEADLDNPEKESHRSTLRPSQQAYINNPNPPPSPQHRRLNNSSTLPQPSQSPLHLPRSLSPPPSQPAPPPPSLPAHPTFTDKYGHILPTPPPPPPLSPARAKFPINDDATFLPPPQPPFRRNHGRSGSDAAAEREQAFITSEQQLEEAARWKAARQQPPPTTSRPALRSEPSRDPLGQMAQMKDTRQRKRMPTDVDDWQHISPPGRDNDPFPSSISGQIGEPNSNNSSRISPSVTRKPVNQTSPRARPTSPYTTRPLIPPPPRTQPPPVPPHSNEARSTQRSAGIPVPQDFLVRWKGESKVGSQPNPAFSRLGRVNTKSMDSLRSTHPQNLQPGGQRRPNALPVSRPSRDHLAFSPSGLSGTPKSYENSSRLPINNTRPPPTQYNGPESSMSPQQSYLRNNMPYSNSNSIISTSLSTSTNAEPYPRPQSATGDHVVSPSKHNGRQMHSPTYGPTLEPYESARSPRATSPSRPYHLPPIIPGPRPRPGTADRALDSYNSGFETSHSTPPRSPVTPQSPRRDADEPDFKIVDDTSPRTYVPNRSSEDTIKQDERSRLIQLMGDLGGESTVVVPRIDTTTTHGINNPTTISITTTAASLPPSRVPSPPLSATNSTIYDMYHDDSSDAGGGNGTWIRKPMQPHLEEKPKLKVQIETPRQSPSSAEKSNPSTGSTATLMAPPSLSNLRANAGVSSSKAGGLSEIMMREREKEREKEKEKEREREREREKERERQLEREWEREKERERTTTTATFADDKDGWALRPPPEAVYERLEHYFRNHDLDKPVIEATSGGTSPTSTEPVAPPPVVPNVDKEREKSKIRAKKSIRYVAEDAKRRIDRTSKADSTYANSLLRKRNTKFWGGKLEEVTTHQAKSSSTSSGSSSSPDSPSGGASECCL